GDLFLVDGAHPLVADPSVVGGMELVELEALLLDGREQADRDADEAESDGPVPDGSHGWHDTHDTSPAFIPNLEPDEWEAGSQPAKNSRAGLENCPVVVGAAQYDPNHDWSHVGRSVESRVRDLVRHRRPRPRRRRGHGGCRGPGGARRGRPVGPDRPRRWRAPAVGVP